MDLVAVAAILIVAAFALGIFVGGEIERGRSGREP